ncbi:MULTISPECIES: hypothetical protein [Flavobacterium]|uniref:hypothetical protein n=1 Tax=Flavobacterium TaxID=237 RepID=UPI00211486AA|nr:MULTISPECIES: hypothetical protein [Flavobacterium]UUF16792.1 hypothetical protein NLJ00_11885 [Flavobacterium panici]
MKILALLFLSILIVSCTNKPRNFEGIGEIKLGQKLNSLKHFKSFKKLNENEYQIDSFKISPSVGFVKNLIIKTESGEIFDVTFDSSESTNNKAIDSLMEIFGQHSMIQIAENKSAPFQIIEKSDGDVDFSKTIDKKDPRLINYRYFDIKKLINIVDNER